MYNKLGMGCVHYRSVLGAMSRPIFAQCAAPTAFAEEEVSAAETSQRPGSNSFTATDRTKALV